MGDTLRVAVLVGSLRRDSFSRKVARVAIALASNSLVMEIVEIGDLPLYNEDLEETGFVGHAIRNVVEILTSPRARKWTPVR